MNYLNYFHILYVKLENIDDLFLRYFGSSIFNTLSRRGAVSSTPCLGEEQAVSLLPCRGDEQYLYYLVQERSSFFNTLSRRGVVSLLPCLGEEQYLYYLVYERSSIFTTLSRRGTVSLLPCLGQEHYFYYLFQDRSSIFTTLFRRGAVSLLPCLGEEQYLYYQYNHHQAKVLPAEERYKFQMKKDKSQIFIVLKMFLHISWIIYLFLNLLRFRCNSIKPIEKLSRRHFLYSFDEFLVKLQQFQKKCFNS